MKLFTHFIVDLRAETVGEYLLRSTVGLGKNHEVSTTLTPMIIISPISALVNVSIASSIALAFV